MTDSLVESILRSAEARRKRMFWAQRGEEMKLAKVRKRNHPKRHGENRERAQLAKKVAAKAKHIKSERESIHRAYKDAVRRYWQGQGDHP